MAVTILPLLASIQIIPTGLDPVTYPGLDGVFGLHGINYPNGGYTTIDPPSLVNANRVYSTENFSDNNKLGILLPISSLGVPTVVSSGGGSLPQYRHPRWSRF